MVEASSLSSIGAVIVGILAVIAIVGGVIWLGKKGYFEPDTNEQTIDERQEFQDTLNQEFDVPIRKRVGAWSLPMKAFVGALGLTTIAIGYGGYHFLKTGSPASQLITQEIRYAMVGLVGIYGGLYLKQWFDDQIGYLDVTYERAGAENETRRIPYAKRQVERQDGRVTVPEIAKNRLLGLFWRYRQIREDRRLRARNKPLDDIIVHEVPLHADERPDGSGFQVTTTDSGDHIIEGASSPADVTYSSPDSLSEQRAIQLREQNKRKQAELEGVKATNAELDNQIRTLRKKIENDEYHDRKELLKDFEAMSEMLTTAMGQFPMNDRMRNGNGVGSDSEEATT